MGLEIIEQVPDVDAVVIPVGGGGLIAGCAVALKTMNPKIKIIVRIEKSLYEKNNLIVLITFIHFFKLLPYMKKKWTTFGPFKYYISKEVGRWWGQKMAIFADLQYYLRWRRWVGGPKKAKKMRRNT